MIAKLSSQQRAVITGGLVGMLEAAGNVEYASCLFEPEFWDQLLQSWELYVELGDNRRQLSRMVRGELAHIPKDT